MHDDSWMPKSTIPSNYRSLYNETGPARGLSWLPGKDIISVIKVRLFLFCFFVALVDVLG